MLRVIVRGGMRGRFETERFDLEAATQPRWKETPMMRRWYRALPTLCAILLAVGAPTVQAAIPAAERAVLTALYASANGGSWSNSTNWNGAAGTECTWRGITCDSAQSTVTGVRSLHQQPERKPTRLSQYADEPDGLLCLQQSAHRPDPVACGTRKAELFLRQQQPHDRQHPVIRRPHEADCFLCRQQSADGIDSFARGPHATGRIRRRCQPADRRRPVAHRAHQPHLLHREAKSADGSDSVVRRPHQPVAPLAQQQPVERRDSFARRPDEPRRRSTSAATSSAGRFRISRVWPR